MCLSSAQMYIDNFLNLTSGYDMKVFLSNQVKTLSNINWPETEHAKGKVDPVLFFYQEQDQ